eukprot:2886086-Amphidinium_carterae.1
MASLAGVILHPAYNGLQSEQSEQTQVREDPPHAMKRVSQFPKNGDGWARERYNLAASEDALTN